MSDDDIGSTEYWRDIKVANQEKRASNREASAKILREVGIAFKERNFGAHLIVSHGDCVVNFYPGTGKWIVQKGLGEGKPRHGRGVFNLLRRLGA